MSSLHLRHALLAACVAASATAFAAPPAGPEGGVFQAWVTTTHAGPGPHPTGESADFRLLPGNARWAAGDDVIYRIVGEQPLPGANNVTVLAEATWDALVTTRSFLRNDTEATGNPCTGAPNTIAWAPIDGPGGVLGQTGVCRNLVTREIVGFDMVLDSGEDWHINGSPTHFDVGNVASHEWSHVAGLGHTRMPRAGCLTAYPFIALGETQKRTPGLGDKLGMDALYATGDTAPGPGCGA